MEWNGICFWNGIWNEDFKLYFGVRVTNVISGDERKGSLT